MKLPNPLIAGFHPDPSVCRVGDVYYLVTSTFEYMPGLPIFASSDLIDWKQIGHVVTRSAQFDASQAHTNMGLWAPTIRWHDGSFYVIVSAASIGTKVFSAVDPAGQWSDGVGLDGIDGIDPDLAWDDDGTCYVTYSGLALSGPERGRHHGIQQVRVDLSDGSLIEPPRSLWSGTGLKFPEAPHLYKIGDHWYLMIAEGGTERGHSVSIARSDRPDGPFTAVDLVVHREIVHVNTGHMATVPRAQRLRCTGPGTASSVTRVSSPGRASPAPDTPTDIAVSMTHR